MKSARRSTAQSQKLPKRILPWFIIHNRGKNEHFGFLKAQNFSGSFSLKQKETDLYVKNLWSKNRWKVYYENMGRSIRFYGNEIYIFQKHDLKSIFLSGFEIKSNELDTKKSSIRSTFCQCRCKHVQTVDGKGGTRKKLLECEQKVLRLNCRSKLNKIGRFPWTRACPCNSESLLNIYFSCLFPDPNLLNLPTAKSSTPFLCGARRF